MNIRTNPIFSAREILEPFLINIPGEENLFYAINAGINPSGTYLAYDPNKNSFFYGFEPNRTQIKATGIHMKEAIEIFNSRNVGKPPGIGESCLRIGTSPKERLEWRTLLEVHEDAIKISQRVISDAEQVGNDDVKTLPFNSRIRINHRFFSTKNRFHVYNGRATQAFHCEKHLKFE